MAASAQTPTQAAHHQQLLQNCPAGLEGLAGVKELFVYQQGKRVSAAGMFSNKIYIVKNDAGRQMFIAAEENSDCNRMWCGSQRSFTIRVIDNSKHEVINLQRPLRSTNCCCPCCLQEMEVQAPPGTPTGYVIQNWSLCVPKFTILNERREPVLRIVGQFCVGCCSPQVYFKITTLDPSYPVGEICKQPIAALQHRPGSADTYGITFPVDLDVKIKAALLGACILIDFMYFEKNPAQAKNIRDALNMINGMS